MLVEKLRRYQKNQNIIGFCKWKDGDGLLFGRVVAVDDHSVLFALVNPLGDFDEEFVVAIKELSRLTESPEYVERLALFASLAPHEESKGETTSTRATIRRRLAEAAKTGECVELYLLKEPRHDYRVVRCEADLVELEEFGDDPRVVVDTLMVRVNQIEKLRWRSSGELAVTRVWKSVAKKILSS